MSDEKAENSASSQNRISSSGLRGVIIRCGLSITTLIILLVAAGKPDWINAWIYTALYLSYFIFPAIILTKISPELMNERGKFIQRDTQSFDRIFFKLNPLLNLIMVILSGIDAVRFKWSNIPVEFNALGVLLLILAFSLSFWAMKENAYFETSIRIQIDRDQKVCSSGPYKFIRHPGYLGMVLLAFGNPLVLGSLWGLIPGFLMALLVIVRTRTEDLFLRTKLPGYKDYTDKTQYLLLPSIW